MTSGAPRSRPSLVTAAVVLWSAVLAVDLVRTTVQHVRDLSTQSLPATLVIAVIGLAFTGWFAFGALRIWRGSGRARFWMAVLGALSALGSIVPPYDLATVTGLLSGVAAVLPYLPGARPFFPPRQPRATKRSEQRVTGWDPDTGEPIRATD